MKPRRPKSELSKRLTSETMKKRWAERKKRQAAEERQQLAAERADYERRKKAGLLTPSELEQERQKAEERLRRLEDVRKLAARYAREQERRLMLATIGDRLRAGEKVSPDRAFMLAKRYFQKMFLTKREEDCIRRFLARWNESLVVKL